MRFKACVIFASAALSWGCGDEEGPGTSGVPPATNAQDFTLEQLGELCEWTNSLADEPGPSVEQICTYKAVDDTDDPLLCAAKRDQCVADARAGDPPDPPGIEPRNCARIALSDVPDDCRATVGEIEACADDWNKWRRERARIASCDQGEGSFDALQRPASCEGAVERCTKLWD